MKVGVKISLLGVGSVVVLILVGGIGYYCLQSISDDMEKMYSEKLTAVQFINDTRAQNNKIDSDVFALMVAQQDSEQKVFIDDIRTRVELFNKDSEEFKKIPLGDAEKVKYQKLMDQLAAYREVRSKILDLAVQNKNQEAFNLYMTQGKPMAEGFVKDLGTFSDEIKKSADMMNAESRKTAASAGMIFVGIILLSILFMAGFSWMIIKQITGRLHDFTKYIDILAGGDFSKSISQKSLDDKSEFGTVSRMVDKMKNNIHSLVKELTDIAEQLAASSEELTANAEESAQASDQIASAVSKVAEGSERQLAAADNTTNVVEQMSTAIEQVAVNTETVANSAEDTANAANKGEDSIKKAVSQMEIIETKTNATADVIADLEEKSKQIGQIVDVISNISGQTNLLALNAAIEAARAGEAGKGFAVVAEEVRKLAEQSQDAAKQITELISEVQTKTDNAVIYMNDGKKEVDVGAKVVSGAGDSFGQILSMVRNMTGQIHEISAAVEEITSSTQDVVTSAKSVNEESQRSSEHTQTISASAQEQSSSIEEVATASEHLAQMAEKLEHSIRRFKI
nr:methyl-accepting chemotaxis protein [Pectinatus haikarae]